MTDFFEEEFNNNFDKEVQEGVKEINNLFNGFLKPMHLKFNCINQDMRPIYFEKTKNGYKATCRSVGISAKDISVTLKEDYIHLEGKSIMDEHEYSTSCDIPLLDDIRDNIENIRYKTENGITIIYINTKKKIKQMIDIQRIDDEKGCSLNDYNNYTTNCKNENEGRQIK
mgnify:CR=1 FL=1